MKKYKLKPYDVPAWIMPAIEVLKPRERLTVSKWAEKNRVLDEASAMPGPWRNNVTPYLVGVMDAFSDSQVERIIFIKSTQIGGTAGMENMLGSLIDQDPGPTMVVYPSDDLAEGTAEARLGPMIKKCPELARKYREADSKKLKLKFDTMTVYLTGANSPADLSSKSIRYLFLDEVDKFPGASKREADPVSLAIERTKTYTTNKKIFLASTPTLKTGHIWRAKEAADVEKHYFVPCPHCGKMIELKFAQIKWPSKDDVPETADRAEMAVYVCQACGCLISDQHKGQMLRAGRWQIVSRKGDRQSSVAFWINTLYSPFTRFSDIAREFMASKDDPEKLQNFANSWLAEPWEDTKLKTSAEMVLNRQTELAAWELPEWTKLLTAGIDVQENCLYWVIRAWGDYMTSQNIAHGQALAWDTVVQIMNKEFSMPNGEKVMVCLGLVDSGDQTDAVYEFCMMNSEWALPSKGTGTMLSSYRLSTIDKAGSRANGTTLVLVDGGKYKDMIAARMRKENGRGSWMVHRDCDLDYAEQVTSEHKITERAGGKTVLKWTVKSTHADNHYLDCEVYAAAAADIKGVRSLFLENYVDGNGQEIPKQAPTPQKQQEPEENWIRENDNWI
ncbi:MAG: terminase gpA endonuclease subunit [Oscillibacter sp.]